jgi:hypothetical protein
LAQSHRKKAKSTLFEAIKISKNDNVEERHLPEVIELETLMTWGVLDNSTLDNLTVLVKKYPDPYNQNLRFALNEMVQEMSVMKRIIVEEVIHEPQSKVEFEICKREFLAENLANGISNLSDFVTRLNNDWRSIYRALYILTAFDHKGFVWKHYAERCNPDYPYEKVIKKFFEV